MTIATCPRNLLISTAFIAVMMLCHVSSLRALDTIPKAVLTATRIRLKALETFGPNLSFSCLETITRRERSSTASKFHTVDALLLEVAMIDGKELFSWPGDRTFSDHPPRQIVVAGLTTTGEFLANVKNVLMSNNAVLSYVGEDEVHRSKALQYHFSLSSLVSGYHLFGNNQSVAVATNGYIWVNADTLELIRLEMRADAIPSGLGIANIVSMTDFAVSVFEGRRVLLPDTAVVTLTEESGRTSENQISFGHFREYSSSSSIQLSSDGSLEKTKIQKGQVEEYLPGRLSILLKLTQAISFQSARVGDKITAITTRDVKHKRDILIPKGTVVFGRIRLAERLPQPQPHFILGLEFNEAEVGLRRISLLLYLNSYTGLSTIDSSIRKETTHSLSLFNRGRLEITDVETTTPLRLSGVGTFVFAAENTVLPVGFEMEWVSVKATSGVQNSNEEIRR